jgi:hypothetical protein
MTQKMKWKPPDSLWANVRALQCNRTDMTRIETKQYSLEYVLATPRRKAAGELYEALVACKEGLKSILSEYNNDPKCYELRMAEEALSKANLEQNS